MSFHRHHRRCLDTAVSHIHRDLRHCGGNRTAFSGLVAVVSARSNLMSTPMTGDGRFVQLEALRNLAAFHRAFIGDPCTWPGAQGHPLVVVDSLARHVLGRYPTSRFLASVWFGEDTAPLRQQRHWFIAHARGKPFRDLQLPLLMTRKMEHVLLHGPHHLDVTASLRRAEVLGLGGSPELATAILATQLGRSFAREELWRPILELMCRHEAQLDLVDLPPLVEYVASHDATVEIHTPHGVERRPLRDRTSMGGVTLPTLVAEAKRWHRSPARRPDHRRLFWTPSKWRGFTFEVDVGCLPPRTIRWEIVEIVDSYSLVEEGYAMRNCVATYAHKCKRGAATIWSLRRHGEGDQPRSLLTIEVDPRRGAVVQVKGPRNRAGTPRALELLRAWATREQLELRT